MKGKGKASSLVVVVLVALVGCGGFLSLSDSDDEDGNKPPPPTTSLSEAGSGGPPDGVFFEGGVGLGDGGDGGLQIAEPNPDPNEGRTFWSCAFDAREFGANEAECQNTLNMRGCWEILPTQPAGVECLPADAAPNTERIYCMTCGMLGDGRWTFSTWWCVCK